MALEFLVPIALVAGLFDKRETSSDDNSDSVSNICGGQTTFTDHFNN